MGSLWGGLKKQGIPLAIQSQGEEAVSAYLQGISDITGFDLDLLLNKFNSADPNDQQDLDDILRSSGKSKFL